MSIQDEIQDEMQDELVRANKNRQENNVPQSARLLISMAESVCVTRTIDVNSDSHHFFSGIFDYWHFDDFEKASITAEMRMDEESVRIYRRGALIGYELRERYSRE